MRKQKSGSRYKRAAQTHAVAMFFGLLILLLRLRLSLCHILMAWHIGFHGCRFCMRFRHHMRAGCSLSGSCKGTTQQGQNNETTDNMRHDIQYSAWARKCHF